MKHTHEFRDPIHVFVTVGTTERNVIDSRPFQRLRHIHQLAATSLVYPGATHRRFEHSLGVMHLAGQVFDIVNDDRNVHDNLRSFFKSKNPDEVRYWRGVVRLAALCHDIGHLPFSHAAEELLPDGWDHERITHDLIMASEISDIFARSTPPVRAEDVAKIAIGPRKLSRFSDIQFDIWETVLSEIIVGDAFGVDRIDYLLRDAYHAGVAYGRFDHLRLLQTLRILPREEGQQEPWLGVEAGGLEAAEAMALARYFMYKQVYFHHVRRAYDIHLKDFLKQWLQGGFFPTDINKHLEITDNEVLSAMLAAAERKKNLATSTPDGSSIGRTSKRFTSVILSIRKIIRRQYFRSTPR